MQLRGLRQGVAVGREQVEPVYLGSDSLLDLLCPGRTGGRGTKGTRLAGSGRVIQSHLSCTGAAEQDGKGFSSLPQLSKPGSWTGVGAVAPWGKSDITLDVGMRSRSIKGDAGDGCCYQCLGHGLGRCRFGTREGVRNSSSPAKYAVRSRENKSLLSGWSVESLVAISRAYGGCAAWACAGTVDRHGTGPWALAPALLRVPAHVLQVLTAVNFFNMSPHPPL
jgi:hypothetical protein